MTYNDRTTCINEVTNNHNSTRVPLSKMERERLAKIYPYYGAQGIIDYVDNYLFNGTYLLIAEDGENLRTRRNNIANIAHGKFWVNNHAHILSSENYEDLLYIYYYLNNMDIKKYLTGSVQPKLNMKNLENITLYWPEERTRNAIVNILFSLDNKIENNNAIIANLEAQAQMVLNQELNKTNGKIHLKEVMDLYSGFSFRSKDYVEDGHFKILTIKNIEDGYINEANLNRIDLIPKNIKKEAYLKKGDILFSMTGNVGRTALVYQNDLLLNQRIGKVLLNNKKEYAFYYFLLRNSQIKKRIIQLAHGTAQANLGKTDFLNLEIPYDKYLIKEFSKNFNPVISFIINLFNQNNILKETRDSLLPELISGKIEL